MHQSFLGLLFNITVLIVEYKRAAFAQTFSLGYKPIRPSYFYPEHPGHYPGHLTSRRPPQIISEGWLWPEGPDASSTTKITTTTVKAIPSTASTIIEVPNRRPDLPKQEEAGRDNTPEINHWFRPVIITNTLNSGSGNDLTTTTSTTSSSTTLVPSTTTLANTTSFSTQEPSTLARTPQLQFLPEGDLFTSAPVRKKQSDFISSSEKSIISTESTTTATTSMIVQSPEGNVSLSVADLLPLPVDLVKNGSAENLNVLLPVLPLKMTKDNDIN